MVVLAAQQAALAARSLLRVALAQPETPMAVRARLLVVQAKDQVLAVRHNMSAAKVVRRELAVRRASQEEPVDRRRVMVALSHWQVAV